MILLELGNRIIYDLVSQRVADSEKKNDPVEIVCADFDGVLYHISTPNPDRKGLLQISIQWRCIPELMKHGAGVDLKKFFGPFVQPQPEQGYHVTLQIDFDNIPGDKARLAETTSLLKRHLLAAPFKKTFYEVENGKASNQVISIPYRDAEAFYIKPEGDRVTVIFSIQFKDAGDQILAKNFLQAFADVRKTISNAPAVTYSQREAPLELQGVPGVKEGETAGFVSFVLFQAHINAKNADRTVNHLQTFRNYLHYHIKCAKGYMHQCMRNRVDSLLLILNRARPTDNVPQKEKKLASGRTFVRK